MSYAGRRDQDDRHREMKELVSLRKRVMLAIRYIEEAVGKNGVRRLFLSHRK